VINRNVKNSLRASLSNKELLDTVNSVAWFFADAFWLMGWGLLSTAFFVPTLLTGIVIVATEKRRTVLLINLAIFCWILMNGLWMVSDVYKLPELVFWARSFFGLGALLVVVTLVISESASETFSHFRRFRFFSKIK
jgi:hypothetical protein